MKIIFTTLQMLCDKPRIDENGMKYQSIWLLKTILLKQNTLEMEKIY